MLKIMTYEEKRCWDFQLFAHVPPFFTVIGQNRGNETDWPWQSFGNNASTPERQPDDFEPDTEPKEPYMPNRSFLENKSTKQKWDQDYEDNRNDVAEISDQETRLMYSFKGLRNFSSRIFRRSISGGLFMNWVRIDIELIDRLWPGSRAMNRRGSV